MPSQFNDNNANVNKSGLITTGMGGFSDGSGNATYPYANDDAQLLVPANLITSDTLPALTYATGDIPDRVLAASTTHKVTVPFPFGLIRTTTIGVVPAGANPITAGHGILIKNLALFYRVNTTTITSFTTFVINTAPLAAGAALPTVTALTTTLAGNTLTAAANVYAAVSTVTTPAWISVADTLIWGLATIVIPGSSTVDILGASWRVAIALH